MLETHKKLEKGIRVDPTALNILVLGGIVNILCQSEAVDQIQEKVKILEQDNVTNKVKMEYLETWVINQHDIIEDLNQKFSRLDKNGVIMKESSEIVSVRKKVLGIELDLDNLKKTSLKHKENPRKVDSSLHVKKCKECEENFVKNSDLEKHLIDNNSNFKLLEFGKGMGVLKTLAEEIINLKSKLNSTQMD